jgi:sugar phosphate isomerase/epimerase
MTNRRDFIKKTAAALSASVFTAPVFSRAYMPSRDGLKSLGVQLFSIPKLASNDFSATMKMVAGLGYKEIEFFGPYTFSPADEKARWESVTPALGFSGSGFFGLTAKEARKILDDNGLVAPSMHSGLPTLQMQMGPLAETANTIGAKYVILPSAQSQSDLDGYKRQADEFSKIGEQAKKNGIRFAYHNHGNGLQPINGKVPFDLNNGADRS